MRIILKMILTLVLVLSFCMPCLSAVGNKTGKTKLEIKKIAAKPTADHRKFKQLKEEFKRGPEVTKACLSCHTEAARQVHATIHWTWGKKKKGQIHELGKAYTLNSF